MKKRFLKLTLGVAIVFVGSLFLNVESAEATVIVEEGGNQCVCKGTVCEPGAFITFRRKCGKQPCKNLVTIPSMPDSNAACL